MQPLLPRGPSCAEPEIWGRPVLASDDASSLPLPASSEHGLFKASFATRKADGACLASADTCHCDFRPPSAPHSRCRETFALTLPIADDIAVHDGSSTLLQPLSLRLEPGQAMVLKGEQPRVSEFWPDGAAYCIAAASAGGARLVIADKPTKGLDAARREEVAAMLQAEMGTEEGFWPSRTTSRRHG